MPLFIKIKDGIINLNDVKHISLFQNSISVYFLSTNGNVTYTFDSEDAAKNSFNHLWHNMKLLSVAK